MSRRAALVYPLPSFEQSQLEDKKDKIISEFFVQDQALKGFIDSQVEFLEVSPIERNLLLVWQGDNCRKTDINKARTKWGVVGAQSTLLVNVVRDV